MFVADFSRFPITQRYGRVGRALPLRSLLLQYSFSLSIKWYRGTKLQAETEILIIYVEMLLLLSCVHCDMVCFHLTMTEPQLQPSWNVMHPLLRTVSVINCILIRSKVLLTLLCPVYWKFYCTWLQCKYCYVWALHIPIPTGPTAYSCKMKVTHCMYAYFNIRYST